MLNIFESNIQCLPSHLAQYRERMDFSNFRLEKSRNSLVVPSCFVHERWSSLHSLYDPTREHQIEAKDCPIILGLAGLFHIMELLKSKTPLILIEPNQDYFRFALNSMDLRPLFLRANCLVLVGEWDPQKHSLLEDFYSPYTRGLATMEIHRRSASLWQDSYWAWEKKLRVWLNHWEGELQTQSAMAKHWFRHILLNLKTNSEKTCSISLQPRAVLLGAGPLVEDPIDKIASQMGEYSIIASDSVLPLLLEKGIIPDLIVSMDSQWASGLHFYGVNSEGIPLLADLGMKSSVARRFSSVYFTSNKHPLIQYLDFSNLPMETGLGNITGAVVPILPHFGVKELIIWGADFGFPPGKPYCRSSYIWKYYEGRSLRTSPSLHGSYCFTQYDADPQGEHWYSNKKMQSYKNQFMEYLKNWKGCKAYHYKDNQWNISYRAVKKQREVHSPGLGKDLRKLQSALLHLPERINHDNSPAYHAQEWVVLYPLCAEYLRQNFSVEQSLNKARHWALGQMDYLLAT